MLHKSFVSGSFINYDTRDEALIQPNSTHSLTASHSKLSVDISKHAFEHPVWSKFDDFRAQTGYFGRRAHIDIIGSSDRNEILIKDIQNWGNIT